MKDINNQTEFWNTISKEKSFNHQLDWKNFNRFVKQENTILDYGCGYGRIMEELWKNGYHNVIGIDPAKNMIERGKKSYPHLNLNILDNHFFLENNNRFDVILLIAVLNCIPTDTGQIDLFYNLQQLLKPGGYLYISDLLLQTDQRNVERYEKYKNLLGIYGVFKIPEGGIFRHHRREWIQKLTCFFHELSFIEIQVTTMNNHLARGFRYWGRK
jgi:2-polyprenyl-3-methyl-5-hydroxy-6-metoxy-1,4-benzoquinol methylase